MDGKLILTEQWRYNDGRIERNVHIEGAETAPWQHIELPFVPMHVLFALKPDMVIDMDQLNVAKERMRFA